MTDPHTTEHCESDVRGRALTQGPRTDSLALSLTAVIDGGYAPDADHFVSPFGVVLVTEPTTVAQRRSLSKVA